MIYNLVKPPKTGKYKYNDKVEGATDPLFTSADLQTCGVVTVAPGDVGSEAVGLKNMLTARNALPL
jgi:hypothetical protein